MKSLASLLLLFFLLPAAAQTVSYPQPLRYLSLRLEDQPVKMAYMDLRPDRPNGATVVLLHGKNFNGFYWKGVMSFLQQAGYRVIVPDQVGWGYSDKPDIHYSFHLLARNTRTLLDSLGIRKIRLVAHSMGGMLAVRFALMYPDLVDQLVLENPIGLEDYKTFIPYRRVEDQLAAELKSDRASLRQYQQSYYPEWKAEYEVYVQSQYEALQRPNFRQASWASALTYQMIYEQPVVYELSRLKPPTLLIIGQEDRTVVGKNLLDSATAARYGQYPELGRQAKRRINRAKLVELKGVGHIPHIQAPADFQRHLLAFLGEFDG